MSQLTTYTALALQIKCKAINQYPSRDTVIAEMHRSLERIDYHIGGAKKFIGPHLKLVVLPEYFMTSYPMGEGISGWREKACISKDHQLFEVIGDICRSNNIFLSGNYYEQDENFPNLFFQASFIIDDQGKLILNYRRLNSMFSPTPHDVLDRYIELYGRESLFPVVDTSIGKLACIASEEILYPEVARCLMMRGAEVFCHSSSEMGSPLLTKKNVAKLARAIENMAYVVSANSAGISDHSILENSTDGGSKIVHYEGQVLAEASPGESMVAYAPIHLSSLRDYRETLSMKNYIARQRFDLYADSYKKYVHYPSNAFLTSDPKKEEFIKIQKEVIDRLYRR